jgi:DNA polymerase III epsilon subunit-like protein
MEDEKKAFENFFLFWDVESTSNNPTEDDIISIGAVLAVYKNSSFVKVDEFHTLVFTRKKIDPNAFAVHHITQDSIKDAPKLPQAVHKFKSWLQANMPSKNSRLIMVSHNGSKFDDIMLFCNCMQNRVNYDAYLDEIRCSGFIDSLKMLRLLFKNQDICDLPKNSTTEKIGYSLGICYQSFCGGDVLENAHDALADSQALFDVLCSQKVSKLFDLMTLFNYVTPRDKAVKAIKQTAGISFQRMEGIIRRECMGIKSTGIKSSVSTTPIMEDAKFYERSPGKNRLCLNCMTFSDITSHTICHEQPVVTI